jgi:gluconolactonase
MAHPHIRNAKERFKKLLKQSFRRSYCKALQPQFRDLFPAGTRIERLATGFQFTEGPIWRPATRDLLFSDIPANRIYRWHPATRQVSIFREPSGHANGLTGDRQGRLIACEHGPRRVTRTELDGSVTVLADQFEGKRLNSPNDVVVAPDGSLYFTDPPYGIRPDQQEQPLQGVYHIAPEGAVTCVVADGDRPNGLVFSPDGRHLYIDDSARYDIRIFDVNHDGSLSQGRLFYALPTTPPGPPDGMTVDGDGRLYCTGPGGVWVFTPAGEHLGSILLAEQPANCTWGDEDGRSLYITAQTSLFRVRCTSGWTYPHRP